MSVSQADVVGLYLAYFGRPPDPAGVAFYVNDPGFDIWGVAAAFSASPESQRLYGSFGYGQINAIYQNLFNRDAEPDGLAYWYGEVQAGRLTPGGVAFAIYLGAQNEDKVSVQNKLLVATEFVAQLDTQAELAGYSGDIAAARARAFIHAVDSTSTSVAVAEALLVTQVAYATGLIDLAFGASKGTDNVVSFTNAGLTITVTEANGALVFTSGLGNGSATLSGTIAGFNVPAGVTLSIPSTLADGRNFSGAGTSVVIASATGEDVSTTVTGSGADVIELTSGQNYTLTTSQLAIARIGAAGTVGNVTDAGTMTVIGTFDAVAAAQAGLRAQGADIVVGTLAAGANIAGKSVAGIDRIDLAAGTFSMTDTQAALIGLAPGTQTVKILNSADSNMTLAATVENVQLSDFSGNAVIQGAAGQAITGGAAADTITAFDGVTSTSDLKGGANIVIVTDGADISAGEFDATGGTVEFLLDDASTATMSKSQLDLVSSADGTQDITLGDAVTGYALRTDIEAYTLGDFTNSVVMSKVTQVVTGGTGADTVTAIDGVTSNNDLKAGANVVVVTDGADLSKASFLATGGTLSFNVSTVTTAKLSATEAAHIGTGAGTQTIEVMTAANNLDLAASVETFTLGNFTNTVTLGAAAQNVTGGSGSDTVTTDGLAASGTLSGGTGSSDKLIVDGTLGAATVTGFELLHVADDADISLANGGAALGTTTLTMGASDLTMTVAQNEGMKTSASVSGSGQSITLADAGTFTAIAGVETYRLAAGSSTTAIGSVGQTFNAGALADGEELTLTGSVAGSVTLVAGDLDASAVTSALTVTATTGTNVIATGSGNDTVTGGAGADTIDIGTGTDVVVLNSLVGADTITGFGSGDKVQLSKATFTGLGAVGALPGTAFESSAGLTSAATAAGRVIYDSTTGDLYYDADGAGGSAAVLVATLTGVPTLAATNFVIIS